MRGTPFARVMGARFVPYFAISMNPTRLFTARMVAIGIFFMVCFVVSCPTLTPTAEKAVWALLPATTSMSMLCV